MTTVIKTTQPATPNQKRSRPVPEDSKPKIRIPDGKEIRGFALYVGIDELKASRDGTSLAELVEQLKALLNDVAPSAQTYASVALATEGAGGRDVDVVRLALGDPAALAQQKRHEEAERENANLGAVIDLSRKRLLLDNEVIPLTFKEFELLQFFVLREGRTVDRQELITGLWHDAPEEEIPNERTIDVHVRRLRIKLGDYQDIVRTVRGIGYRFDRHADVTILFTGTPSPDVF
jgi:DNA-binding response OmpR family regulator